MDKSKDLQIEKTTVNQQTSISTNAIDVYYKYRIENDPTKLINYGKYQ